MKQHWVILVSGYGAFVFEGTEVEAENMRAHKSRWERGVAHKRLADAVEVTSQQPSQCWNHAGFNRKHIRMHCDCGQCKAAA